MLLYLVSIACSIYCKVYINNMRIDFFIFFFLFFSWFFPVCCRLFRERGKQHACHHRRLRPWMFLRGRHSWSIIYTSMALAIKNRLILRYWFNDLLDIQTRCVEVDELYHSVSLLKIDRNEPVWFVRLKLVANRQRCQK